MPRNLNTSKSKSHIFQTQTQFFLAVRRTPLCNFNYGSTGTISFGNNLVVFQCSLQTLGEDTGKKKNERTDGGPMFKDTQSNNTEVQDRKIISTFKKKTQFIFNSNYFAKLYYLG